MATLSYNKVKTTGTAAVAAVAASAGGDSVPVNAAGAVKVTNGSAGAVTVTVLVPGNTRYGLPDPDITVSIPAGAAAWIGPFTPDLINAATGLVDLTYSAAASVTVEAISL